jgi:hypothetical protein
LEVSLGVKRAVIVAVPAATTVAVLVLMEITAGLEDA